MDIEIQSVISAWRKAGKILGIEVLAPFDTEDNTGSSHKYAAFIPDFGNSKGTLVLVSNPPDFVYNSKALDYAKENGYYCSIVNYEMYMKFDREFFIATLDDWQYFGKEENKPSWYSGKPWT